MELHIRDISKTYFNGVQALNHVTLTIPAGMYGLLGPNGAGKSTLMRIFATLQEPDDGSIRFGDIDVVRQKDRVRETLGYLPQSFGFHPRVSADRLLEHFALLKGLVEPGPRRDVVESLLRRRTNLWDVRKQRVGTFSGGMRQRLGVAVALLGNPTLIPLGLLAMTGLLAYLGPEVLGPFRVVAYLQPFLLFSLPNLVLVGAILFTIGMLARHVVPVYLGAIGIFIGHIVALNYANQIESPMLATLVDPLGLVTLERMTGLWTTAERNARLIGLPATLAWNRALWLAVAAAALALLHRSFRFTHADGSGRRLMRRRTLVAAPPSERVRP